MKILIAGAGKFGMTLARQLTAEGHDLTVIDNDPAVLENGLESLDIMAVEGNCISMETLRAAEIAKADLLIAVATTDEVNLLCCVTAHGMNPALHTIARVRNPEYIEQAISMRDAFGLSLMVNPEKQAAVEIERLLKYPGFLKRDTFAKGRAEIVELRVDARSPLCDAPLTKLNSIVGCKVLVCAVLRDGSALIPRGDFVLADGDRVFVTAPTDNLSILLKSLGIVTHKVRRVMIAGGSRISFYLAKELLRSGMTVHLVERNPDICLEFAEAYPDAVVVQGDVSNQDVLESEGLGECDALVSLTGLDELNMVLSIYGQSFGVPQVITKLGRADNPKVLDSLELGSVICPRKLSCTGIVRYVRAMQNQEGAAVTVHSIADGQAEAVEFRLDEKSPHCGEPLKNLRLRKDLLIAAITHGAQTEIPGGDSRFEKGDSVVIVSGGGTVIRQFSDIFAL